MGIFKKLKDFFTEEPEDTPLLEAVEKTIKHPSSLLEHISALRKHITRSVVVLLLVTIAAFSFARYLLDFLALPLEGGVDSLVAIEVTEPLSAVMRISLLVGFAISVPYITFEMWLFIAPGLKPKARIGSLLFIPFAVILFFGGMAFSFYVILPSALPFLINFMDFETAIRPASYIRFITGLLFWIGIAFEFPLVIYIIARMGWIKAKTLAVNWRIAIIVIAVLSAAITPTIDPYNMSLVMFPMIFLFLVSIALAKFAEIRRVKTLDEDLNAS